MKIKFFLTSFLFCISILSVGYSLLLKETSITELSIEKLGAIAFAQDNELPPVEISCDSGGQGTCYQERLVTRWLLMCIETNIYCDASGNPQDSCMPSYQLICNTF
ncbi:MAG: hypothetical protein QM786_02760 [Breznakibacter sp.]